MDSWWSHCTHSLEGGHVPQYCELRASTQWRQTLSLLLQWYIVKLLKKEKVKPEEILCTVNAQYGEETLFHASVYDWHHTFCTGCKIISNLLHAYFQSTAAYNVNNHRVEELILRSRLITVRGIASSSRISTGNVETIIHEHVLFKKVST
jgi:L-lactate permease